jgi:hypothetical protein
MRCLHLAALCAVATTVALLNMPARAQVDSKHVKPAPVIVRFQAHSMHANDFQTARSKHREIELQIKQKGMDVAFTEWMQRDHPFIFAKECVRQVGEIATEFKSTNHMLDFDKLIEKRGDLRIQANKYGHDVAFAEWLRTERPELYREHFGIKPARKERSDKQREAGKR